MSLADPIADLAHDHAELNAQIVAITSLLRGGDTEGDLHDALVLALAELRDHLFHHFAREEEGLFPFIASTVPDLANQVEAMSVAHDTICGTLARAYHLADTDASPVAIASMFERFQHVYAAHASTESSLLRSLDRRLDSAQRAQLGALVDGL